MPPSFDKHKRHISLILQCTSLSTSFTFNILGVESNITNTSGYISTVCYASNQLMLVPCSRYMKLAVVSWSHRWKITSAGRFYEIMGLLLILLSSVHVYAHTIKTTVRPAYYEHYTRRCSITSQYVFNTFPNTPRSNPKKKSTMTVP